MQERYEKLVLFVYLIYAEDENTFNKAYKLITGRSGKQIYKLILGKYGKQCL